MKSPFKFLDAFTVRDRDEYFGRDTEVDALYGMVFRTPLTLVYGLSGTGKTSIIQCGLASRFEGPDWLPFFLRRNQNINDSLRDALLKDFSGAPSDTLPGIISALFDDYLRPVYLIFDQFEELFILGRQQEQKTFAENLRQLIDRKLPCRVILVIREEYLGQLYNLEKEIPTLFDHRLRIEPMSNARVGEVLQKSFDQFNIRPEAPAETLCDLIIENVSGGKSGIQLPYLQVYLDRLYQADYRRTFGETAPAEALPELEFTRQEIMDFGSIEGVLDDFVREQSEVLQRRLEEQFPGVPEKAVRSVLDAFVTEEGTKRPVFFKREQAWLLPDTGSLAHFPKLGAGALTFCFEKLEAARLLRITDNSIELAHDSLAALIDGQRSAEQRDFNDAKRRIAAAMLEREKFGVYLTERQLVSVERFRQQLEEDATVKAFLGECDVDAARKMRVAKEELEKTRRRLRMVWGLLAAAVVGVLIAMVAGLLAWEKKKEADRSNIKTQTVLKELEKKEEDLRQTLQSVQAEKDRADSALTESLIATYKKFEAEGKTAMASSEYEQAIRNFNSAISVIQDRQAIIPNKGWACHEMLKVCQQKLRQKKAFEVAIQSGDMYMTKGVIYVLEAINDYETALQTGYNDNKAKSKLSMANGKKEAAFLVLKDKGISFANAGKCDYAVSFLIKAQKILQDDEVEKKLKLCNEK